VADLEGVVAVADEIRAGASTLVARLHDLGVERVVMLTGDNERTERAIGEEIGVLMGANGVIRQNIWASLGVKAVLVILVPFGYVPIWLAVLAGDAGMTVGVTGNAIGLSRVTP